jgi:putative addiction module component (TIGR02574 family)
MSIQQLEQRIRSLSPEDLAKFSHWFDTYRMTVPDFDADEHDDAELSAAQRSEIDDRLAALDADPSITVPWEGTMEVVKTIREKLRAQKAADRRD